VLHQPRQESFARFDDLLLLAPGGRTVYFGTAASTQAYFQRIGYQCGRETSLADYVIDVIAGKAGPPLASAAAAAPLADAAAAAEATEGDSLLSSFDTLKHGRSALHIQDYLVAQWSGAKGQAHRGWLRRQEELEAQRSADPVAARQALAQQQQSSPSGKLVDPAAAAGEAVDTEAAAVAVKEQPQQQQQQHPQQDSKESVQRYKHDASFPSWPTLVYLYGYRYLLQSWRSVAVLQVEAFMFILAGCVLGMAFVTDNWFLLPLPAAYSPFCPEPLQGACTQTAVRDTVGLQTTYIVMALGLVCAIMGNRCFGAERDNMRREKQAGASLSAYFVGKSLAELPLIVAYAFVFCVAFWTVCSPAAAFGSYYATILLFCLTLYGIGYVSSVLFLATPENALLLSAIAALLGGLATDALSSEKSACWGRWTAEAIFLISVRSDSLLPLQQDMLNTYMGTQNAFVLGAFGKDLLVLAIMAIVLRAMALAVLYYKFRK